jgi:predicted DNA-binding transcriptional regulator YafY
MRDPVFYLVASAWNYPDVRLYALHRFSKVAKLNKDTKTPNGFNLDNAIAGSFADFADQGEPIKLEIRCAEPVAAYLIEMSLSADQSVNQDADGLIRIAATVNDTWQLRWWLLRQGTEIEVCVPPALRTEIKSAFVDAVNSYAKKMR